MAATVQFDHIYHDLLPEVGSKPDLLSRWSSAHRQTEFRVATSGMAWKGQDSEGVIAMPSADIKWAQWIRVARNFQLRVGMRDHRREKFDGFMREVFELISSFFSDPDYFPQDHDRLARLLKDHFGVTLETREVSFKGWNWGVTDFQGAHS